MKTIYINGVMLDRCSIFLQQLARRFKVAGPGLSSPPDDPDLNFIDSQAAAGKPPAGLIRNLAQRIVEQSGVLAESLAGDITFSRLGPEPGWKVPPEVIKNDLLPRVGRMLHLEQGFRNFLASHPVDLVISGSDYGSHSRIITMAAKEQGIATLNIEHGFFFTRFKSELIDSEGVLPTLFTSDFANLDNALEMEGFAREAANLPHVNTKFLALGTPVETVASSCLDRDEALKALGLTGAKKRVLLLGSWIEARAINSVVNGQIDIINTYEDLLRSLAESDFRHEMELLIKVHPADGHPEVFEGVKAAIEQMAAGFGLPVPLIYRDQLAEVLGASDVVISLGFSSVLFDVFQLGKQSVVLVPEFLVPSKRENWATELSIPLQEGVMVVAENGTDTWARVQSSYEPGKRAEFAAKVDRLSQLYSLGYRSVEDKSESIIEWIEEYLAGGNPSS